jgi:tRNA(adenine34) deaminase
MPIDFHELDHEFFMREALIEARLAGEAGERPIGAVIVHQNQIVGRGRARHQARQSALAHAEMNALLQTEQYLYSHPHECVLYTTVEPCVMCLGAIVMSDIDHVVYSLADNWIKPSGMLMIDYVRRHIKNYVGGVLAETNSELWERVLPHELIMIREGKLPKIG